MRIFGWPRGRRRGYAMAIATAVALAGSVTAAVPAFSGQQAPAFDLDHGNALLQVVYPQYDTVSRSESLGRATLTVDRAAQIELPWFDAISPYLPKAVGIFANLGRRPAAEDTTRNINIAVLYCAFTSLNAVLPAYRSRWLSMMQTAGLDPNNTAEDPTTPSGIGILAARNALAYLRDDGANRYGDIGGNKYNVQPYADYTGYEPVNTAYDLRDPSRWQPNVIWKDTSTQQAVFTVQQFALPQYAFVRPFAYTSPAQFHVSPPTDLDYHHRAAYRQQADQVIRASANLTDQRKMTAEFFNDKVATFGAVARAVNFGGHYDTVQTVEYVARSIMTLHDSTIATWYFMRKFDSVRPFSAIRYLYGDKKITAWGGPGTGTVSDITGDEWQAYLYRDADADYPSYPSVTAAACLAFAQLARDALGTDNVDISVPTPKGSSVVEPGITPATDLTLHWSTLSDFATDCGQSGIWGGEDFPAAVTAAGQYAPRIGDLVYQFVQRHLNGG